MGNSKQTWTWHQTIKFLTQLSFHLEVIANIWNQFSFSCWQGMIMCIWIFLMITWPSSNLRYCLNKLMPTRVMSSWHHSEGVLFQTCMYGSKSLIGLVYWFVCGFWLYKSKEPPRFIASDWHPKQTYWPTNSKLFKTFLVLRLIFQAPYGLNSFL